MNYLKSLPKDCSIYVRMEEGVIEQYVMSSWLFNVFVEGITGKVNEKIWN